MRFAIFGFKKRPQVDSQNTGRDVYQRPFGVATVSANGQGGVANFRSLSPTSPTSFNRPLVTPASIEGIGNDLSTNPHLEKLVDKPRQF